MYSFKEKNKHLRRLLAREHAEVDLEMLKRVDPRNNQLPSFEHSPVRHAENILYTLLDFVKAEEIRENRRQIILAKEQADREAAEKAAKEQADRDAAEKESKEQAERDAEEQAEKEKESENRISELESELEDAEIERDDVIEERDELEDKLSESETALEETNTELEAEKKSVSPPKATEISKAKMTIVKKPANAKKKTNTPASTGKTSRTKTSK